jgi:pimeloyl-[acyl-carrier protein] synthase
MSDRTGDILRELLQPEALDDPYPVYERLRKDQAAGRDRGRLVLGHAEAVRLLGDRSWSSDRVSTTLSVLSAHERAQLDALERTLRGIVAFQDPPDHSRVRRLLQRSFTPSVVRRQREVLAATTDRVLSQFARDRTTGDVMAEVMLPIPALVVAGILGIPEQRLGPFESAAQHLVRWFGAGRPDLALAYQTRDAITAARSLIAELLVERRDHPTDDLLSAMLEAVDEGDAGDSGGLSDDEMLGNAIFLMTAGHETTANALANSLIALLDHPDQLDSVRDDDVLPDLAIDELLRFDSPVQLTARLAREDREHGGAVVRRGGSVIVVLGAANRDPERFDEPNELRLDRADNQPLSFAHGAHYCLGAALAKEELRVVLPSILRSLPGIRLAARPSYQPTLDFRGPTSLMVTWR